MLDSRLNKWKEVVFTMINKCFICMTNRRTFSHSQNILNKSDYATLGLKENAAKEEVKKAYYELAKMHHPDTKRHKIDEGVSFYEISEAYKRLLHEKDHGKTINKNRRNLDQPGWYGWDSRESYFNETRVVLRKMNIAFRLVFLCLFSCLILRNIFAQYT